MAEPTLQEIFGAGAIQDATTITILKADLPMTASANNRGEQAFAAIVKKASVNLTSAKIALNTDQSIEIVAGFDSLVYRTIGTTTETRLQSQLNINFTKPQLATGVTPDDY